MSHVARLASQLVAIRSENPPGNTRDCAEFVRDRLDELGLMSTGRLLKLPAGHSWGLSPCQVMWSAPPPGTTVPRGDN